MKVVARREARRLRRDEGLSLKEIVDRLGVSKSSASVWTKDIQLTSEQKEALERRVDGYRDKQAGADKLKEMARQKNEEYRAEGRQMVKKSAKFGYLCSLYWGEGGKERCVFSLSNCDPGMLKFVGEWLVENGYEGCLSIRVQYYGENGVSEDEIKEWWMKQLPFLKPHHFRKFTRCEINRASQRKKIGRRPYGTATLTVCRKELVQRVYGGIDFIKCGCNSVG